MPIVSIRFPTEGNLAAHDLAVRDLTIRDLHEENRKLIARICTLEADLGEESVTLCDLRRDLQDTEEDLQSAKVLLDTYEDEAQALRDILGILAVDNLVEAVRRLIGGRGCL